MLNISLSEDERKTICENILKISTAYRYNRKIAVLKWCSIFVDSEPNMETMKKGLRYFKKLRNELSYNIMLGNDNLKDLLDKVIEILGKTTELAK